jgi:hypothetical protein
MKQNEHLFQFTGAQICDAAEVERDYRKVDFVLRVRLWLMA